MVITLQPSRFPTETSKVLYAGSFLRDTPFLWFQPFVTIDPQPKFMLDFKKFCAELRKNFGDPDEEQTAERQNRFFRSQQCLSSFNRFRCLHQLHRQKIRPNLCLQNNKNRRGNPFIPYCFRYHLVTRTQSVHQLGNTFHTPTCITDNKISHGHH